MFSWYHILLVVVPVAAVCWFAVRCRRYVRSVTDYLAAGRCAGRYLLVSTGMMGGMSVISFVGNAEMHYNSGWAYSFWGALLTPLGLLLAFYGWISYRFRETRAMSCGQYLEMRYSRGLRWVAGFLRGVGDTLGNCIGPAVAVRFIIYLCGIPHRFALFGCEFRTFPFVLTVCLCLALLMILTGGRISLLVTDAVQGLVSYPLFVILVVYVLTSFSWWDEIAPVMADRVPGESFINPYDVQNLRDFNLFAILIAIPRNILGGAWIGNGSDVIAKTPHEGRMAGVLNYFGVGMFSLLPMLFVFVLLAVMNHDGWAERAVGLRQELSSRVAEEVVEAPEARAAVGEAVAAVAAQHHEIGVDPPLSRLANLDTPTLDAAHGALLATMPEAEANQIFQGYRTTYMQQMLPVVVRNVFPKWIVALLLLLCILLTVSTDDTRIFDASKTWTQDFVLPMLGKAPSPRAHLLILKGVAVAVGVLFWFGSYAFRQLDYINMFVTIAVSLWTAGAGVVVTLGLYWRRGTTAGAWSALVSGGLLSVSGMLVQRNWADGVLPWLVAHGWDGAVRRALEAVSRPMNPWIDWKVPDNLWAVKFPVNSTEISFFAFLAALVLYVTVSLLTCRTPFNLEKMLHRGKWADAPAPGAAGAEAAKKPSGWTRFARLFVAITPEHTRGDKFIAWFVFFKSLVYGFLGTFVGVAVAAKVFHWGVREWSIKFFVTALAVPLFFGVVTTVWFTWGTLRDIRRLFADLEKRDRDNLDNGIVEK